MLPQPFLPTDLCKSLFLATAPGHCGGCKAHKAMPMVWALSSADEGMHDTIRLDWCQWKGCFLKCIQLCLDTAVGEDATGKETRLGKMYFTINQLSLSSFVAVAFKQLFLHLVKDQLCVKTSERQCAEDSRPASRYKIHQTGLSSFPLWFTSTVPNGLTLSKVTSPASACEFLRPDETGWAHTQGERHLSPAVIQTHWVTPWATEQLLLQLVLASAQWSVSARFLRAHQL